MSGGISPISSSVNALTNVGTQDVNIASSQNTTGESELDQGNLASELEQIQNSLQLLQPEQSVGNQLDVEA